MGGAGSLAASPASGFFWRAAALLRAGHLVANAGQANQQFTNGVLTGTGNLIVAETSVLQLGGALGGAGGLQYVTMGPATLAVAAALPGAGSLGLPRRPRQAPGVAATLAGAALLTSSRSPRNETHLRR